MKPRPKKLMNDELEPKKLPHNVSRKKEAIEFNEDHMLLNYRLQSVNKIIMRKI